MIKKIDKFWAFATIFMNGWLYALPSTEDVMPIWLTPMQLVHGVFIYELLLIIYLGFLITNKGMKLPVFERNTRSIAVLITGFGLLGIFSAGTNFRPLIEIMGSSRHFILAVYFLLLIHWGKKYGPTFVLRSMLLGIAGSGAMNIYYAYTIRWNEFEGLPFLIGQNGPGGPLGLSVILSAWLMLERKNWLDTVIALASCFIGVYGASISYSKTAMLLAGFGLITWGIVLTQLLFERGSRRMCTLLLVILLAITLIKRESVINYLNGVNAFIYYKFSGFLREEDRSIEARSQYFIITKEIMLQNPLFGVGYGGFYDAVMSTGGYNSDRSTPEDAEGGARRESNPHSSFLYYASANGFPGLFLSLFLLMKALLVFRQTLSGYGITGVVLWVCIVLGYFIYGMTLPSLFNTSILYLPVAAAIVFKINSSYRRFDTVSCICINKSN